jgi:NitT/TauT family transport system ATP-binding protein
MGLVQFDQVEVAYADRTALGPLDLAIAPGEITALVGPSGSGKSTALRLLAGLEPATRGRLARDLGPSDTAVVFQAPTLMPWASALANAALPLTLLGRRDARERAQDALARVGLSDAGALRPAQLSGGMAMRVSLARALTTEPKLLLLDEPFAALDEVVRRRLADDLLGLWAERRPAIVFVTHNVEEAVYIAQRVLVLGRGPGRIVHEARTPGALPRPAGFRTDAGFRETVERISAALEAAA